MNKPNGCGPDWFPPWIKERFLNCPFKGHCNTHDIDSGIGGDEVQRFAIDWKFWKGMRADIKKMKWYKKPFALVMAVVFYLLCRWFGWHRFNYKESLPCE